MNASPNDLEFNNLPNRITMIRILLVPIVVGLLLFPSFESRMLACALFILASATDALDGYVARVQKKVTVYGKLLDPLADKFLVTATLIMLQHLELVHPAIVILLICRELAVTGLRALASAEGMVIQASISAKLKTIGQMIGIPLLIVPDGWLGIPWFIMGISMIWISLGISLWSAGDYLLDFIKALTSKRRQKNQAPGSQT